MKINILGGMSGPDRITIISSEFISKAFWKSDGMGHSHLCCTVTKTPSAIAFLRKIKKWPVPRLIYLWSFFWVTGGIFGKFLVANMIYTIATTFNKPNVTLNLQDTLILLPLFIPILIFIRLKVATWHAAEHMAIKWYLKHGTYDTESIQKETPIEATCGGRLMLPFFLAAILAEMCIKYHISSLNRITLHFGFVEIILWIDLLIGFDKIPIFSHASILLQKYITTKVPEEMCEIETASLAMRKLVEAHCGRDL